LADFDAFQKTYPMRLMEYVDFLEKNNVKTKIYPDSLKNREIFLAFGWNEDSDGA